MITLFGRKYAQDNKELVASLFDPSGTANGTYKRVENGLLFHSAEKGKCPRAFLRCDGLLVSCHKPKSTIRYLFALTDADRLWLNVPESYIAEKDGARALASELFGVVSAK